MVVALRLLGGELLPLGSGTNTVVYVTEEPKFGVYCGQPDAVLPPHPVKVRLLLKYHALSGFLFKS